MANFIQGVPNIVVIAGGAFLVYYFFIRDEKKGVDVGTQAGRGLRD